MFHLLDGIFISADCPANLTIDNGYVVVSANNKLAAYRCYVGFRLLGASSVDCLSDGTWSAEPPKCVGTYVCSFVYTYSHSCMVHFDVYMQLILALLLV